MAERCGDRQRKFDGLEKWPFRLFIDSLPIMLQIALLLLACGLSRYVWSVNTSVARIVISFPTLGLLFYIWIVAAGTSSYECPFQTPVSIVLRGIKDSATAQRLLVSMSPSNITSLIYAAWVNSWQGIVSTFRRIYDVTRYPFSWEISLSHITSGVRGTAAGVRHQTITLLLRIDQAFGNVIQMLVHGIQRFRHAGLLPTTNESTCHQQGAPQNSSRLLVRVWNLEARRKQNTDNARCVCWVLRNITDPEAIDSAIRLAGSIRWFDGDPDHDPPFDSIVSTFEACFDSTKQLYPGMRDRAYFSARAILQINLGARTQPHECSSKYPIPEVSLNISQHTDPDLHHIIRMLECNFHSDRPILYFPRADANTHNHLLWASNLFVDLTRMGPNPILGSYESYLSAAIANHRATISNILLMWHMFLGGRVEEETFWAIDKSYAVDSLTFSCTPINIVCISDSLEAILSHLSVRVMNVIGDGDGLQHLNFLLEFLVAWDKRPACLTPMTYGWCSAISEVAGRLELGLGLRLGLQFGPRLQLRLGLRLRLRPQDLASDNVISEAAEQEFSQVGESCDSARMGNVSQSPHEYPREPIHFYRRILLSIILEVGFRLVAPGHDQPVLRLDHTPHHNLVFEAIFSSNNDEVIADGVCAWIADEDQMPAGSCVHYLTKCVRRGISFSPRLRRLSICAIERVQCSQLRVSVSEIVHLLNRLDVDVGDMGKKDEWLKLLVDVIHSPVGLESLSIYYWHLLDKLVSDLGCPVTSAPCNTELMVALEETGRWEELEVWMAVAWQSFGGTFVLGSEELQQVTFELLLQRPSALPRFEDLSDSKAFWMGQGVVLQRICAQARAEPLVLEPQPP